MSSFLKDYSEFDKSMKMIQKRIENQIIQKIFIDKVKTDEKILRDKIKNIQVINKEIQKYSIEVSKNIKEFIKNF